MEYAFQTRYQEGNKVFYVFPLNWKGKEEFLEAYQVGWNNHWRSENEKFETSFLRILTWNLYFVAFFCLGW
jgi:hypothetical protein